MKECRERVSCVCGEAHLGTGEGLCGGELDKLDEQCSPHSLHGEQLGVLQSKARNGSRVSLDDFVLRGETESPTIARWWSLASCSRGA